MSKILGRKKRAPDGPFGYLGSVTVMFAVGEMGNYPSDR